MLSILLALSILGGDVGFAVVTGGLLVFGVFNLFVTRKHGALGTQRPAWGGEAPAKRLRLGAKVVAGIGVALVGYGALYAIDGQPAPAIVIGVICAGIAFVISWVTYTNARFVDDVAAAIPNESVRLVCPEVREPWRRDEPPAALVLTQERVAQLRASVSGVSEVASIAIREIVSIDANFHRGSLVVHGRDAEMRVRRATPVQVQALFEALREAGVPERAAEA